MSLAGAATVGGLGLSACGHSGSPGRGKQKITLKLSQAQTLDSPEGRAAAKVAARITELTNGEVELHTFPNYTLAPSDQVAIQQLVTGALDIGVISSWTNLVTAGAPFELPYAFSSLTQVRQAFAGTPGQTVKATANKLGVQLMNWWVITWRNIYGDRIIHSPADFKGVKIRTQGTKALNTFFSAVGAQPQSINSAEAYLALQTHQVDLVESSYQFCQEQKHYEVAKNASSDQHGISTLALLISNKTWAKLNADQRTAVAQAFNESVTPHDSDSTQSMTQVESFLRSNGMTFNDQVDLAPFRKIATGLYPRLVTDATQQTVLSQMQAMGAAGAGT